MAKSGVHLSRSCVCIALALAILADVRGSAAQGSTPDCPDAQACRELALEARARGAHEAFHDLAWRAVQTGRPNDPELMYLLARAQALSGRRRDALVVLRRLAETGTIFDAATDEDFRRVRELGEWQGVLAIASRPRAVARDAAAKTAATKPPAPAATAAPSPAPATVPRPSAAAAAPAAATAPAVADRAAAVAPPPGAPAPSARPVVRNAPRIEPAIVEEAARFSIGPFAAGGLAYDAVSRRFLFGDVTGRRLFVVGEGSERIVDLVRGDSAGFDEVTAIAIDPRRGDLWVATTSASGTGAAVHHLQLISGRVLAKFPAPGEGRIRFSDLAVTADGSLLVLDSGAPRVLVLRSGARALEQLTTLAASDPVSITADEGRTAFVAHRDGITRVDLQARRAAPLNAANGIALAGFEFIRVHRDALVGSQIQPDNSRNVVRLTLDRDRRSVTRAAIIETPPSGEDGPAAATIAGSDLYYLVAPRTESQGSATGLISARVKRLKLP